MAGPGIYLSASAGGSQEFGDTLLLFRVTGSDGKGSPCSNQEASQFKALNVQFTGAARTTLPFLVEYLPERPWYIIPRAPQTSNGEHAYFDLPHQGDAAQVAEEMIFGKSESELLHNLANVLILTAQGYDADHPGEPMCRTTQPSASMDFLQEQAPSGEGLDDSTLAEALLINRSRNFFALSCRSCPNLSCSTPSSPAARRAGLGSA